MTLNRQMLLSVFLLATVGATVAVSAPTGSGESKGSPVMKLMLLATETEVIRFNGRGEITWRTPSGMSRDVWQLGNGNVLFPFNQEGSCGVREVTADGKTVWEYKLPGEYVISCHRCEDGTTLVGASCIGAVLVVSPDGAILHTIKVRDQDKRHSTTIVRRLDNGHILVVEESTNFIAEYSLDGKIVWEMRSPFRPFGVERIQSGNTLISGQKGIVEVTPEGKIVWQLTSEDVKEMDPRWFAGFRVLPNENIIVCNPGGTVPVFEVNRKKQVVWHTTLTKDQVGIAHGIYVLSE